MATDKKTGGGLFTTAKPKDNTQEIVTSIAAQMNDLTRRIRVLEERNSNFKNKIQMIEQSQLRDSKQVHTEIKTNNTDVSEIRKEIDEIKSRMLVVIKELKLLAKKEDVEVLRRYLEMWQPVKFVTQNEIESIVSRILDEKGIK
jgi:hypothetical protein